MKPTTLVLLPNLLISFQLVHCNLIRDVSTTVDSGSTSAIDTSSSSTINTPSFLNQLNDTLPISTTTLSSSTVPTTTSATITPSASAFVEVNTSKISTSTPATFKLFAPSVLPAAATTPPLQTLILEPTQSVEAGNSISTSSSDKNDFRVGATAVPNPLPDVNGKDLEQGVQGPAVTETQSLRPFIPTTTVVDVPGTTAEGEDEVVPTISTTEGATQTRTILFPPTSNQPGETTETTQPQPTAEPASNSNISADTNPNTATTKINPLETSPPSSTTPTTLKTGTRPPITIIQLPPNPTNSDVVIIIDGVSITLSRNVNGTTAVITPSVPRQTLPVLLIVSSVSGKLNGGGNGTTIGGVSATGRVISPTASVTGGNGNVGPSAVPGGLLPDVDGPGSGGERVVGMRMGIDWLLMFCVGGAFVWF